MIRKLVAVLLTAAAVIALCSGCSANIIEPVDALMTPPVFYEEYEDLVAAFKGAVGADISFCSPISGDYRSAIIFNDMNGDGSDEALVFYSLNDAQNSVRMHYLCINGGKWASVADFAGYGVGVESVTFEDFNASGFDELLVTWSIFSGSASKVLSVYKNIGASGSNALTELTNITYNAMLTVDADSDGRQEIFYIDQSTSAGVTQRSAKLLKINEKSVMVAGETKLDGNVSGYVSIKTEKASADAPLMIFADALKGETQMITEVVYWDSEASDLAAPLLDYETLTNSVSLRNELITSRDVNGDGLIDIPTQPTAGISVASDSNLIEDGTSVRLTEWINITDGAVKTVLYSYVNCAQGYMLTLEASEAAALSVRQDKALGSWSFLQRISDASGKSQVDITVFTLAFSPVGEEGGDRYSDYSVIMSNQAGKVYYIAGDEAATVKFDPAQRISAFNMQSDIEGGQKA